jgi:hypothetical protein
MIRNHKLGFFGAALVASLVACHPVKPPQSASSARASVQCADASTVPASTSREAREVIGAAPAVAMRTPCLTETTAKQPAELPGLDDPMWRRDMP